MQATRDPRVAGLALLNPWVRSDAGLARARVKHYYRQRPDGTRLLAQAGSRWRGLAGAAQPGEQAAHHAAKNTTNAHISGANGARLAGV